MPNDSAFVFTPPAKTGDCYRIAGTRIFLRDLADACRRALSGESIALPVEVSGVTHTLRMTLLSDDRAEWPRAPFPFAVDAPGAVAATAGPPREVAQEASVGRGACTLCGAFVQSDDPDFLDRDAVLCASCEAKQTVAETRVLVTPTDTLISTDGGKTFDPVKVPDKAQPAPEKGRPGRHRNDCECVRCVARRAGNA